jgi:hypothetical protein
MTIKSNWQMIGCFAGVLAAAIVAGVWYHEINYLLGILSGFLCGAVIVIGFANIKDLSVEKD